MGEAARVQPDPKPNCGPAPALRNNMDRSEYKHALSVLEVDGAQPTIGQLVDDAMAAIQRDNLLLRVKGAERQAETVA